MRNGMIKYLIILTFNDNSGPHCADSHARQKTAGEAQWPRGGVPREARRREFEATRSGGAVMRPFVAPGSIVRSIWGDADTILLVFAGSAAEFALNRAVDWLFYTSRLPDDPLGRLFSTAEFARQV